MGVYCYGFIFSSSLLVAEFPDSNQFGLNAPNPHFLARTISFPLSRGCVPVRPVLPNAYPLITSEIKHMFDFVVTGCTGLVEASGHLNQ